MVLMDMWLLFVVDDAVVVTTPPPLFVCLLFGLATDCMLESLLVLERVLDLDLMLIELRLPVFELLLFKVGVLGDNSSLCREDRVEVFSDSRSL